MGLLNGLFEAGGAIYGMDKNIKNVEAVGDQALADARSYGAGFQQDTAFKPFTVTSGLGNTSVGANGGTTSTLSADQQTLQSLLQSQGTGFLNNTADLGSLYNTANNEYGLGNTITRGNEVLSNVGGVFDTLGIGYNGTREDNLISKLQGGDSARGQELTNILQGGGNTGQDIFNQLQAMQAPSQNRDQLALEQRLFNQGRGGVSTAQYGGTPEQFALSKAQEEARLGAAVQARQFANQEQQVRSDQAFRAMQLAGQEQQINSGQALAGIQQGQSEANMYGDMAFRGNEQGLQQLNAESAARQAAGIQAMQAQQQQYGLGQSLIDQSYRPNNELINQLNPAIDLAGLAELGQRQGAQLAAALSEAGLQARTEQQGIAADLKASQISGISGLVNSGTNALGQKGNSGTGLFNNILSTLFG